MANKIQMIGDSTITVDSMDFASMWARKGGNNYLYELDHFDDDFFADSRPTSMRGGCCI